MVRNGEIKIIGKFITLILRQSSFIHLRGKYAKLSLRQKMHLNTIYFEQHLLILYIILAL